jgi:nitrous oxide reductase accessory protein NosL
MRALLIFIALISTFGSIPARAEEVQDLKNYPRCEYCGMNRKFHAHGRMLVTYDDGTSFGACSIHCAAVNLAAQTDKIPASIQTADFYSKKLIEAEAAWWVIGGSKAGIMTKRAKWAFAKKKDAEKFISEYGGIPADFDEAMKAAYEDMYADTRMIRIKKGIKKMVSE